MTKAILIVDFPGILRHDIIPLLQTRWPGVLTNLTRTSMHCSNAQTLLDELAEIDTPALKDPMVGAMTLPTPRNLSLVCGSSAILADLSSPKDKSLGCRKWVSSCKQLIHYP